MINKIFKTILVLTICLGISIPTNAAVSVSDGSAFVTKAEFAADLNNLSNRMAQLENSLDAKIDSLVSSYLTRNGIWNGAKQDSLIDGIAFQDTNGFVNKNWLTWFDKTSREEAHVYSGFDVGSFIYTEYNVITSFNKTGMLFCNFRLNLIAYGSKYSQDVAGIKGGSTTGSWEKSMQLYLSWYEKSGTQYNVLSKQLVYNFVFPQTSNQTLYSNIAGIPISGTLLAFVSKTNGLCLRPEFIFNSSSNANRLEFLAAYNQNYCWYWQFDSDGFYVY